VIICKTIAEIKSFICKCKERGDTVGLVPTMGYLHEGHLSLMKKARKLCDIVVISIFVNPTQFGPQEDFEKYPRDMKRDAALAEAVGVDAIFAPEAAEMYPPDFCTYVEVGGITEKLCGRSRPGHFKGVATVVTKLFNIVQPDLAVFGWKDAQQALVIKQMVRDLNMDVKVITGPTVREADGLAMSSRNVYLSPEERKAALVLPRSLEAAREAVGNGERDAVKIKDMVVDMIKSEPLAEIDYVEICRLPDLKEVASIEGQVMLAMAVKFGDTRLIDNVVLEG